MVSCLMIVLCFTASTTFGQGGQLGKANKLFNEFAYNSAIRVYKKVLEKDDILEAKIKLAECYRLTNNYQDAEYWYAQVAPIESVDPIYKFYYGKMLQSNGKCSDAIKWFRQYSKLVPFDTRGDRLADACDNVAALIRDSTLYQIELLRINSSFSDFSPAIYKDGIVFASSRDQGVFVKRTHTWNGEPFLDLYFTKYDTAGYTKPESFTRNLNSKLHEGPVAFNNDYTEMYFTRNNLVGGQTNTDNRGVVKLKILRSEDDGSGSWSDPEELPFNNDNYSVAHPSLSNDGTELYFSSDLPGGFGGADIYVSFYQGNRWGPPINLGPTINSEGDEVFPFVHNDGTLFYASDGLGGLGGLDIFMAKKEDGSYSDVKNLGYPLNTIKDDFGLVWDDEMEEGYFSSNRSGGYGADDIYSLKRLVLELDGLVFELGTNEPISTATVKLQDLGTYEEFDVADEDGQFGFEIARNKEYVILVSKEGYNDGSIRISTEGRTEGMFVKIPLEKKLEFKTLDGILVDTQDGTPLAGATVILTNNCTGEERLIFAKEDGSFSYSKVDPNCNYTLRASKKNYSVFTMEITDIEEGMPLYAKVELDKQIACDIPPIYYDLDKYYILDEYKEGLNSLALILKENPNLRVEISSHCDSRASSAYNIRLSQNRTQSVVNYLIQQGVEDENLIKLSFGEAMLVNECSDDVPCDEDKHRLNRRTQFRCILN